MSADFKLERIDAESARILSGNSIVATLNWTDSFWVLYSPPGAATPTVYPEFNSVDDVSDAFLAIVASGKLSAASADLDFLLDPPTFVGPTEGERRCWIYTAHKQIEGRKAPGDMREWTAANYAGAQAIYRRVVRKYGDAPPDRVDELRSLQEAARNTGVLR